MVSQFLLGILDIAPAVAVLYWVIGRHEAHFRHEAMFLALIAGLAVGVAAAVVELFVITGSAALVVIVSLPVVETMAKSMIVGLPRFRNRDETVLLGGAAGLGMASMLLIFYGQFVRTAELTPVLVFVLVTVAIGYTLAHFVSGLVLGQGPAEGRVLGKFWRALGLLYPTHILLAALAIDLETGTNRPLTGHWGFALGILVYGVAIAAVMGPQLVRRGLPPEERARWRRERMREERSGT